MTPQATHSQPKPHLHVTDASVQEAVCPGRMTHPGQEPQPIGAREPPAAFKFFLLSARFLLFFFFLFYIPPLRAESSKHTPPLPPSQILCFLVLSPQLKEKVLQAADAAVE